MSKSSDVFIAQKFRMLFLELSEFVTIKHLEMTFEEPTGVPEVVKTQTLRITGEKR